MGLERSLGVILAIALFCLGYSSGSTVHGLIEDQHVTLVIAPEESPSGPNFEHRCQGDPGEQITDVNSQDSSLPTSIDQEIASGK